MKKNLLKFCAILLIGAAGCFATDAYSAATDSASCYTLAEEQYEAIGNVSVYGCSRDNMGNYYWSHSKMTLYQGVNSCYSYYFKDVLSDYYYPVRTNNYKEFQGKDVSSYSYTCLIEHTRYFFNY